MAPGIDLSLLAGEEATSETISPSIISKTTPKWAVTSSQPLYSAGPTILSPTLITTDFDALRFDAAALLQLDLSSLSRNSCNKVTLTPHISGQDQDQAHSIHTSTYLTSSPYNTPDHYLDLTTLSKPSLILAKALTALAPTRPDYATAPYTSALNFPVVLSYLRRFSALENHVWKETSFYVVVFRSQLKEGADGDLLYLLDAESHREACGDGGGGLLKYWFGRMNGERRNLATCEFCLCLEAQLLLIC